MQSKHRRMFRSHQHLPNSRLSSDSANMGTSSVIAQSLLNCSRQQNEKVALDENTKSFSKSERLWVDKQNVCDVLCPMTPTIRFSTCDITRQPASRSSIFDSIYRCCSQLDHKGWKCFLYSSEPFGLNSFFLLVVSKIEHTLNQWKIESSYPPTT